MVHLPPRLLDPQKPSVLFCCSYPFTRWRFNRALFVSRKCVFIVSQLRFRSNGMRATRRACKSQLFRFIAIMFNSHRNFNYPIIQNNLEQLCVDYQKHNKQKRIFGFQLIPIKLDFLFGILIIWLFGAVEPASQARTSQTPSLPASPDSQPSS